MPDATRIPPLTGLNCYEGLAKQDPDLVAEDADMVHLGTYPPAALLFAAIGTGGGIREEWGVRSRGADLWDYEGRAAAEADLSSDLAKGRDSELVRRFVIVTAAQTVEETP